MMYYIIAMRHFVMLPLPVGSDLACLRSTSMSNARFNLSQFNSALFALTAGRDERPQSLAKFVAESLRDSTLDWLIEGSDALTQVLAKFENSGKSAVAVKFRKIIRGCGASLMPYGEIVGGKGITLTKNQFPGGNGAAGQKDHANRIAVCEALYDRVLAYASFVFQPSVPEGIADPLASFGSFSEKSISIKLASASVDQLKEAVKRTVTLSSMIAYALESRIADAAAADAAAAEAPAPAEAPAAEAPAKRRVISVKRKLAA